MKWTVAFHDEFEPEFDKLPREVQDELYAEAQFVELLGPATGRPHVDKLHGSGYAKMKELRFEAMNDEWRVAFAFDPKRTAILLVAGGKTGVSEKRFYKTLIDKADARYKRHLEKLKSEPRTSKGKKR
ncbi:MAG: type II toxin-antitoxin system RelE/ParE family toxin [Acidobacteriaceae bacterium]